MTVLYSGGGTLGSVSPLLSVHSEMKSRADYRGVWVGLNTSKERAFVAGRGFEEFSIVSPRFRNFESQGIGLSQLTFPFRFVAAFFQSLWIIAKTKPSAHFSAGSFVSIPVAFACFMTGIPNIVHQQDLLPGLANRVMAKFAKRVTVAFPVLAERFGSKAVVTGNPVREEVLHGNAEAARARYGFTAGKPVVFVIGGSSGARGLNAMIDESRAELVKSANALHMTGETEKRETGYVAVKFLGAEIADAYALADVVVSRAGLSTLTELGALGKPTIIVPIPGSHQIENAEYFLRQGAVVVAKQGDNTNLLNEIQTLLNSSDVRIKLGHQMKTLFPADAAQKIVDILMK